MLDKIKKVIVPFVIIGGGLLICCITGICCPPKHREQIRVAFQRLNENSIGASWQLLLTSYVPVRFDFDESSMASINDKANKYNEIAARYLKIIKDAIIDVQVIQLSVPNWLTEDKWNKQWVTTINNMRDIIPSSKYPELYTLRWKKKGDFIISDPLENNWNQRMFVCEILSQIYFPNADYSPFRLVPKNTSTGNREFLMEVTRGDTLYTGFKELYFYETKKKSVVNAVSRGKADIAVSEGLQPLTRLNKRRHSNIKTKKLMVGTNYFAYIRGVNSVKQAHFIYKRLLEPALSMMGNDYGNDIKKNKLWIPTDWPYWNLVGFTPEEITLYRDTVSLATVVMDKNIAVKIYYEPEVAAFYKYIKEAARNANIKVVNGGQIYGNPLQNKKFLKDVEKTDVVIVYIYGISFDGISELPTSLIRKAFWYKDDASSGIILNDIKEYTQPADSIWSMFFLYSYEWKYDLKEDIGKFEDYLNGIGRSADVEDSTRAFVFPLFTAPIKIYYNTDRIDSVAVNYKRGFVLIHARKNIETEGGANP